MTLVFYCRKEWSTEVCLAYDGEEMMTMMIATGTVGPVAVLYLPANSNFGMLFPRAEVFNRGSATPRGSAEILHGGHESFRKLEKKCIFPPQFFPNIYFNESPAGEGFSLAAP